MPTTARQVINVPDFTDSRELRIFCNEVRKTLHSAAMVLHMGASEMEASLRTVPVVGDGMMSRSVQRRRAKRVSRHTKHAAECLIAASAAMSRTWGTFRVEYAPELAPSTRGRRTAFKVVPE